MDQLPCPDGYLLDPSSPLADGHHALNNYLVRLEQAGWKTAGKELSALRDKPLKLRIWKAVFERLEWLRANSPESPYFAHLRDVNYRIEEWKLSPSEADLLEILSATEKLASRLMPYAPMPHVMAYVEEHGLTPALSAALQSFSVRMREEGVRASQTSYQLFCSRLDMLAWWNEWNEVDLKRCWSEQIRADYRAMRGAERENWRRLLHSIQGDEGVRPAPKWLRGAEAQIQAIGPVPFRAALWRWFEPLRRGRTQRLSREGSFILRSFIWLAQSLNDAELTARVGEIAEVAFKPKKNGEKAVRAAAEAVGRPDPTPAKPPQPMPSLDALTARAMSTVFSSQFAWSGASPQITSRVQVEGEIVHIRGDLDTYRMHISTGAVFRESDGKRVYIAIEKAMPAPLGGTDLGGVAELMAQVLILAEDAKHVSALTAVTE